MKLIKPSFEIIEQQSGLEGIHKQVELAGRTCYKSLDKITDTSAKEFVDRMIKSGHGAMLEHGTVYLCIPDFTDIEEEFYTTNPYCKFKYVYPDTLYVSTNLRVLVEHDRLKDLTYLCEPTEHHERRVTVKFICDRVTGESFLRHRAIDEDHPTIEGEVTRSMESDINSFARESTRYCNYSKSKFNGEFTIITPPEFYGNEDENTTFNMDSWGDDDDSVFKYMCSSISIDQDEVFNIFETWYFANLAAQWSYNKLISLGWKAQQARRIIPLDIKSPLVMTAFVSDWEHFFDLRCDASAHPQARELAIPLEKEFINKNWL